MSDNLVFNMFQTIKSLKEASDSLQDRLGVIATTTSIFMFQQMDYNPEDTKNSEKRKDFEGVLENINKLTTDIRKNIHYISNIIDTINNLNKKI